MVVGEGGEVALDLEDWIGGIGRDGRQGRKRYGKCRKNKACTHVYLPEKGKDDRERPGRQVTDRLGKAAQRPVERGDQIAGVFEADRQAQQAGGYAGGGLGVGAHGGVGHRGGVDNQAFDAAQGFGQAEQINSIEHGFDRIETAFQFETHHGAGAELLLLCQGVLGV